MQATPRTAVLILHDIRSAQNVGSLFRTADAAGVQKVYLSATTPTPTDRFGRPRADIAKTALGAEQALSWGSYSDITTLIGALKQDGYTIIAVEQSPASIDYTAVTPSEKMAIVLGNEVAGIDTSTLSLVDTVAEIPMRGTKESLNVSVAGGIVLYQLLRQ